jgi:hypothetical protein
LPWLIVIAGGPTLIATDIWSPFNALLAIV